MKVFVALVCFAVFFSSSIFSQTPVPENRRPPVFMGNKSDTTVNQESRESQQQDSKDDEIIRVETNLVIIPVSVTDRHGRFIGDLRKEEFQVFEDGVPQKIEYFASVEQPFTIILLIDVSASTREKMGEIKRAAISFTNQIREEDRVAVWAFSQDVDVLCDPTSDRHVLRSAIMRAATSGGTNLYDAVLMALRESEKIEGRKAIVLFTDGVDTGSRSSDYLTLKQAEESSAMIYSIRYDTFSDVSYGSSYPSRGLSIFDILLGVIFGGGTSSPGTTRQEYEKGKRYLQELSFVSGGRYYEAEIANLNNAFAMIAEELRRQYSLGYYPENVGKPGQRKQIKVRVTRPNLVVKAKNSYIVGQTNRTDVAELTKSRSNQQSSSRSTQSQQERSRSNQSVGQSKSQSTQQDWESQQRNSSVLTSQPQPRAQPQTPPQYRRLPF